MPIIKSAKKALRQSKKRAKRNATKRTVLQKTIKLFKRALTDKNTKEAQRLLIEITQMLDKATKTHLIHKKTASRKKSKFARSLSNPA